MFDALREALATGDRLVLGVDGIDRARTALIDFKG